PAAAGRGALRLRARHVRTRRRREPPGPARPVDRALVRPARTARRGGGAQVIAALAIVAAMVAEAFAFYVGAELFASAPEDPVDRHAPAAITFVFLALVGLGVPHAVEELALPRRVAVAVMAVVAFVALYGAIRVEFAGDLAL